MNWTWNDRVVLVTGASSGIGAATARAVHARGARPVLAARRRDRLDALAAELSGAVAVEADITTAGGISAAVDAAGGPIDVLVNNAGQGLHVPLLDVDLDDFRAVLELNVVAPLAVLQAARPHLTADARVVNVSSGTVRMTIPGVGAYAATKAALDMLSAVARVELGRSGVIVSTIHPGLTDTEFHGTLRAGARPSLPPGVPVQSAEQVAEALCAVVESGEADITP